MKTIVTLLLFLCFSALNSQTDYGYVYQNDSIMTAAARFSGAEKYAEAIKEYERIVKTDPKYLEAQYEKALVLSTLEKKEELRAHYQKLYDEKRMSDFPLLYIAYGAFLSDNKEYEAADKLYAEGAKYLSNSSSFLYNAAILNIRKEQRQKSVDYLKQAVTLNPNHASSHYFLGLIALEDGQVVQGTIGLMSYLMLTPTGKFAENAILKMNEKYGENYLDKPKLKFSDSGDHFAEIDEILRNQLPLKSSYKIKSEFDDIVIRQMQAVAEYAASHKMENGFFETTYFPWIKAMYENNYFEGFSYYSLLSMEEKLGKKLTSQKKKITAFYDGFVLGAFWQNYGKRKLDMFGEQKEVVVFLNDGNPYLVGPVVDGKREGRFKLLTNIGTVSGELNYKNGELDGVQKYFNDKGTLIDEKTFVNGKLNGVRKEYYTNGQVKGTSTYKDDKLHGLSTTYHVNGGKNCEVNFVNDEVNGTVVCQHSNGSKSSEASYKSGKLNGTAKYYNTAGDLTGHYEFKDGERNGKTIEYYDGKMIKSEAEYLNGKLNGLYKKYYANTSIEEEMLFEGGKPAKKIRYLPNGMKSLETVLGENEEVESYKYFDTYGNNYFEEKFKNNEFKTGFQYSAKSPKPVEVSVAKKVFSIHNFAGKPITTGAFEKGKKTGEWTYRYTSGVIREKENNVAGMQQGLTYLYTRTGALDMIANYKADKLHGRYENYNYGELSSVYNYNEGTEEGPYQTFHPDGSLSSEGYYVDGELMYQKVNYRRNGNLMSRTVYVEDESTKYETFDINGKLENTIDFANRTGKFTIKHNNGAFVETVDMMNGDRNGKYITKDKLGNMMADISFTNGFKHGPFKFYSPTGTVSSEGTYYCNQLHGKHTQHDLVGTLRLVSDYAFGDETGKTIRFYQNKSKMFEYSEFEGALEGDYVYYNPKGDVILSIAYKNNAPVSYKTLTKTGTLGEPVAIVDENAAIVSTYANGAPAISMQLKGGNLDGKYVISNADGKPAIEATYIGNLLEGDRTEYYASGKVYKKERFKNGDYDGKAEYFKEDGKPWLTASYSKDEIHGDVLIYTNGVLSTTKKYDSDELISVN
ncbi:MAG TPA: tetratricopeptide repeat protein [Flavobacterium sp.]|jgi:antitoxin component YwqK of YwqJK toxin-antitoxin module/Tfp pilus assembly protein PilF